MEPKEQVKESSNVVTLFEVKKSVSETPKADPATEQKTDASGESNFLQEMRRNLENAERMKKERLKANQSVLKSYRIKN
jgi:hypothetical protein